MIFNYLELENQYHDFYDFFYIEITYYLKQNDVCVCEL